MKITSGGQLVPPVFSVSSEGIWPRSLCLGRRGAGAVCQKVLGES